jgi:hypothetical protein
MQRYLDGRLDAEERAAFEQELLADETLMADVYDEGTVREALAARARAALIAARPRPRRSAVAFLTVAAAASIAFLVFVLPGPDAERVFRGEAGGAPVAVAPVGMVTELPDRFVWTRDAGALHYRLEIYLASGDRLHVTTTPDTFYVPDGLAIPRIGSWRVTTIDSVGVGVRSTGLVEFENPRK